MDIIQRKSNRIYANLVKNTNPKKTGMLASGRPYVFKNKEKYIWSEVKSKIGLKKNHNILDIGCGCGYILENLIKLAANNNFHLTLIDIPEVINTIKKQKIYQKNKNVVRLISGTFPHDFKKMNLGNEKFDRIIAYSVLHYSGVPKKFIEQGVSLLSPHGVFLVGDIPNLSKKGRFVSNDFGRKFDAQYKNIPLTAYPFYKNHKDFFRKNKEVAGELLSDDFMIKIMKKYRDLGYDVYVLPQKSILPFSYTREDFLFINKNDIPLAISADA